MKTLFLGMHGWELLIIILAIVLLFGGKKIPELMHGLGKGVKSFKDGMNGLEDTARNDHDEVKSEEVKDGPKLEDK